MSIATVCSEQEEPSFIWSAKERESLSKCIKELGLISVECDLTVMDERTCRDSLVPVIKVLNQLMKGD